MNLLAGEGQSVIECHDGKNESRLKPLEGIPLTIYNNGMVLFEGPFRPYSDRETRQFIIDIMDGYFPSELQQRFPEGVPFIFVDRREVIYKDSILEIFGGEGRRLQSATTQNSTGEKATISSAEHKREFNRTLTEEQFLNKLPRNVVKSGKVLSIRSEVKANIRGQNEGNEREKSASVQVIETNLVHELRERMSSGEPMQSARGRPGTPRGGGLLITLRVRSEDGSKTYILKVRPNETIGDIRKYIDQHRKTGSTDYAIVQNFPKPITFDDNKATLEKCGLMSNAALFLRRRTSEKLSSSSKNNNSKITLISSSTSPQIK